MHVRLPRTGRRILFKLQFRRQFHQMRPKVYSDNLYPRSLGSRRVNKFLCCYLRNEDSMSQGFDSAGFCSRSTHARVDVSFISCQNTNKTLARGPQPGTRNGNMLCKRHIDGQDSKNRLICHYRPGFLVSISHHCTTRTKWSSFAWES